MTKRPSELRAEWTQLQAEVAALAAEPEAKASSLNAEKSDARAAMLAVKKDMLAAAAWSGTPQDLADVLVLAEIAWDLWWGGGTFPALPADIDDRDQREVAVAYLVRGVYAVSRQKACPPPTPVPGPTLLWRAILGMREHRDAIEIGVGRLTDALDRLAGRTGLTAAIGAGWDPEGATPVAPDVAGTIAAAAPAECKGARPLASDVQDRVSQAKAGLTTLRTLWNSHAAAPAERPGCTDAFFAFGASMEFVTDRIEALLDEIAAVTDARCKVEAAPPT